METSKLKNFLTIAECGSLTEAAKRLYISQPALSQQIKQREDELGEALFVRNGRNLELTAAGKLYADFARETLGSLAKVKQELNALKYGMNESLHIGICQSSMLDDVADFTSELMQRNSNVQTSVRFLFLDEIMELFNRGALDVFFTRRLPPAEAFQQKYEYIEYAVSDVVLATKDSSVLGDRDSIRFKELDGQKFIIRIQHEQSFLRRCEKEGISVNIICTCGVSSFKARMIAQGCGVGFFPTCCLELLETLGLKYYRIEDFNVKRANYMVYHTENRSRALEKLLGIVKEKI